MTARVLSLEEPIRPSGVGRELRRYVRAYTRSASSMAGLVIVAAFVAAALIGPWIVPYPEDARGAVHLERKLAAPSAAHWFGTDEVGNDVYTRVILGARVSLQIGLINRLLPADQVEPYTYDMARKMATYAPLSLMQSKASVRLCLDNPELRGIAEPAAIAAALYDTEDFHAGVEAFLGKQPLPAFRGR